MTARADVIAELAALVQSPASPGGSRVGVDGVDGAGKTLLADELATALHATGCSVVRVSIDGFHRPRAERYRRGRDDPEGYFRDSYDYASFVSLVLEPLGPAGSGVYVPAIRDVSTDRELERVERHAPPGAVLVVDGIFLHRPELARFWDFSVWLEVPFAISLRRVADRDGTSPDPDAPPNRRYVEGQRLYLSESDPAGKATVVLDNASLEEAVLRPATPARRRA